MESDLERLAAIYGVQTAYHDVEGIRHEAGEDALVTILRVLGAPIETPSDARDALRAASAAAEPTPPPVEVAWDGGPEGLEPGYHRRDGTLVISAPRRAYGADDGRRGWSVFLPLYALRTDEDRGVGDFTDLGRLAEWAADRGGGVATLPLGAAFLDNPYEPSPYSPASRLFLNELYVDPAASPEIDISPEARELLSSPEFRKEVEALRAKDHADPKALMALLRGPLMALSRSLFSRECQRRDDIADWLEARPEARDYALFRAAVEKRGAPWPAWDGPARDGDLSPGDTDPEVVDYHLYVQWLAEEQLLAAVRTAEARGGGLHLDFPLGVTTDGYDVWRHRSLFALGAEGGAPPDPLGPEGQKWGFPPLHPRTNREDGYRYLRACLKRVMEPATSLRIDHVMGLTRLFWVPAGRPASEGVYVRYPAEELYAVLCLESHLCRCRLVGEDLGTVPPEVRASMKEHGVRGMYVLPFERSQTGLKPVSAGLHAAIDTHDMPPFAAWWEELPADDRGEIRRYLAGAGLLDEDATEAEVVYRGLLSYLAMSPAAEVAVNLEDLWGEARPQNIPGTGREMGNFTRRASRTLEEFRKDPAVLDILRDVDRRREEGDVMDRAGLITEDDVHLFNEGTHYRLAEKLGSHVMTVDGIRGTHFAVWAPNAERVTVIGDFNDWDEDATELYPLGSSGIRAGFVPGVGEGAIYKYRIASREAGYVVDKADPFAVHQETPPKTGSIVWDIEYEWGDADWMASRADRNSLAAPMSVYEVHLGSWRRKPEEGNRSLNYREAAPELAEYAREMGYTHIELLPVMEHPFFGSWGYQVSGCFAPTSRYGTPEDFMFLVDTLHRAGIGVILDWVPSHFPADEHGLGYFDGTHLFEHADRRKGHHPDWDSLIFNYDRNEVRSFLVSTALHWLERFHADGLRTDAVASMLYLDYSRKEGEWIPNEFGGRENLGAIHFLKSLNEEVYRSHPDTQTIAEESTAWPKVSRPVSDGGLGFGMKWDMGWMHDTLSYLQLEPIHRKYHHSQLTFRQLYAFTENFMLSLSHDEVVHGKGSLVNKMPGDEWQQFANLRLLFAYQHAQCGKKLSFMGGEFGQRREWAHEESLEWHVLEFDNHRGVQTLVKELNRLHREEPALHERDCDASGFSWVDCDDADAGVLTLLRRGNDPARPVLAALHFTPVVRDGYRVGVPAPGTWRVILNTDEKRFWGSGSGTTGTVEAEDVPADGFPQSVSLALPPLGALFLTPG